MAKEPTTIIAVERALNIIELLHTENKEMGITEIAAKLGEYQSTMYRIISTLESRGYVYQDPNTSKYSLGLKLFTIGVGINHNNELIRTIRPYIVELAEEFGETVNVAVRDYSHRDGYYCAVIYQEKSNERVLGSTEALGGITECFYSSLGNSLLAYAADFSKETILSAELKKCTENSITNPSKFLEKIEKVREQGYAIDDQEVEKGLYCLSCPVLNSDGSADIAISISGYIDNMKSNGIEKMILKLKSITKQISRTI
ncbi:MAG: IclR family transcriptional regulator [Eubacteriaceae bacterium]|jgi:DNA-binding IclR family transcriptional regulator|nr:IclR family transcriptional regulator [Eubacteriaceae bacterium]